MTATEFTRQFRRLERQFAPPYDTEEDRAELWREWYEACAAYDGEALGAAITTIIRQATDRRWPTLGVVLQMLRAQREPEDPLRPACATCHGARWVEGRPIVWDHRVYETAAPCPDCGPPAPRVSPLPDARPLTETEWASFRRHQETTWPPPGTSD